MMWQHYDGITSLVFASLLRVDTTFNSDIKQKIQHIKFCRSNEFDFWFREFKIFSKVLLFCKFSYSWTFQTFQSLLLIGESKSNLLDY